jgi:hypothetical protein
VKGIGGISNTIFGGTFCKSKVPIIDKEQVIPAFWPAISGTADIDVKKSVSVDVSHGYPCIPGITGCFGFIGDIFKSEIAFVEIQLAFDEITAEIDIR